MGAGFTLVAGALGVVCAGGGPEGLLDAMTGGRTTGAVCAAGLANFGVIVVAGVEGNGALVVGEAAAGVLVATGGFMVTGPVDTTIGFGSVTADGSVEGERAITDEFERAAAAAGVCG